MLGLVFYAPALLPGQTLSGSDFLWTAAPWAAERPPDVRAFGSNYELIDSAVQFQPWLEYSRERLPSPPLWNTHVGLGRPFLANAQSAWLSPFSLPAYALPFWWAQGVIALLKLFAAAFGTFLLARALGQRFAGALLAGLVYGFCLYLVVWVSWPQAGVWALLPWLLLLSERAIRSPGPLAAAGLAVVVAAQFFAGHPESSFHLLLTAVAFFAFRLFTAPPPRAGPLAPLVTFAAGLAGGAALAALTLLPFLELLLRSGDVEVRQNFSQLALPHEYLLGFTVYDYWGRATETAVGAFAQERALYVGALPLTLALAAPLLRPTRLRVAVALLGLLALAVALGVWPFPEIAQRIPIVRTGNHLRVVVITMLCLALLAGWGLDDLLERELPRRRLLLGLALGLLVLPVIVLAARGQLSPGLLGQALEIFSDRAWPAPPPQGDDLDAIRMAALIAWLVFMGLTCVLLAARVSGRLAASAFAVLALALVSADLFKAGMGATPAIDTDRATQPVTPGLERLRGTERFVGIERAFGPSPLLPNMALRYGLADARSYDLPVELRYDRLWRRAVRDGTPTETPTTSARLSERSLPAFRLHERDRHRPGPGRPPHPRAGAAAGLRRPRPAPVCEPGRPPAGRRGRRAAPGGGRGRRARGGARPGLRRPAHGRDGQPAARIGGRARPRAGGPGAHRQRGAGARGGRSERAPPERAGAHRPPLPGLEGHARRS